MPSKPHPCAFPGCTTLVKRKEAIHCKRHAVKTPEHNAKVSAALKGRVFTVEHRAKLSASARARVLKVNPIRNITTNRGSRPKSEPIERVCPWCGKTFFAEKPSSRVRFCSRACGYAQRRGARAKSWRPDIPVVPCKVCGKPVRWYSINAPALFCSMTCKNIWQRRNQRNSGTNIELAFEAELTKRGLIFETQVALCSITIADFFLPNLNAAVFCDGDYWHSRAGRAARDEAQTDTLRASGYIVHRFLGSDILSDVAACVDKLITQSAIRTSDK